MSLTKDYKVEWSDIKAMYDNLNRSRAKFSVNGQSFPQINPESQVDKPAASTNISDLKAAIEELKASHYVGEAATVTTPVPEVSTLLKPIDFNNQLDIIYSKCIDDQTDFTFSFCSCNGFGFCGFRGASFNPCPSDFGASFNPCPSDNPSYLAGFNTFGFTTVKLTFGFGGCSAYKSDCHTFCTRQFNFSF